MDTAGATQGGRRRLFSRRELRHRGTRIVRVGSDNVLQANRGQYNFAARDSAESLQPSLTGPVDPDRESIATYSQDGSEGGSNTRSKPEAVDTDGDERHALGAAAGTPPSPRGRPLHKLTHMSEKAHRLRVSPTQRRSLTSRRLPRGPDTISPPSSPTALPPPLDLDQNILSFTQHDMRPRTQPPVQSAKRLRAQRTHNRPPAPQPLPTAARTRTPQSMVRRHLTPLRRIPDRLTSPSTRRPPLATVRRPPMGTQR